MALSAPEAAVLASYQRADEALRARVLDYVRRAWLSLENYRDADIDAFVAAVLPVVEAGQVQMATLTDAYLARVETAVLGEAVRPLGVAADTITTEALRGVPGVEVWRRPGLTVWKSLAEGQDLTDAVTHGLNRAVDLTETNLQLANTHTAQRIMARKVRITGYRRVPRAGRACALCLIAATQRYRKGDLMKIHPGCHCKTWPIYGTDDPGQILEARQLAAVKSRLSEFSEANGTKPTTDPAALRNLVVAHDHGEIGPVLAIRGQDFTGPSQIP